MIPTLLEKNATADRVCAVADYWKCAPELVLRLTQLACLFPAFTFSIIDGYRTAEQQEAYGRTADHLSTHRTLPATGADVRIRKNGQQPSDQEKRDIGAGAEAIGLRWGGGARRVNGIPEGVEWQHFDLGPRLQN